MKVTFLHGKPNNEQRIILKATPTTTQYKYSTARKTVKFRLRMFVNPPDLSLVAVSLEEVFYLPFFIFVVNY
ncbi:hypothetical protein E4G67_02670 [Candidatus Bathyarchaeota archaeon]|nr:MAG: hypothetical protein E4G67_02670 [Candidatus Bathyarchaeota archaeon]